MGFAWPIHRTVSGDVVAGRVDLATLVAAIMTHVGPRKSCADQEQQQQSMGFHHARPARRALLPPLRAVQIALHAVQGSTRAEQVP